MKILNKLFNKQNSNDLISWFEEVWVNDICKQNGNTEEFKRSVSLQANEKVSGDCSFKESFYIGYKVKRGDSEMKLTFYDLKNLNVIKN